ncbi:3-dehydroquinate synthase [Fusobacterium sp. MFO224]|uniref:3-dehydroquinate synthase n=1 Tax=Fusobacterium sp. MFO224 TaxID=3378070 RepID=UPI0038519CF2
MQKIKINLGPKTYDIEIEAGILEKVGSKIKSFISAEKVAIITDTNVDSIYGEILENSLKKENYIVERIVFPAGEQSKNLQVLEKIYARLSDFGLTRSDLIITLGGGVTGDLGGFAAASFLRGVDFIQVPTSLLAQIDSSVGGKVAVDLPSGKNLVGHFYQPKAVYIDPELLRTLPEKYLHDGFAEAIKYSCIRDLDLFKKFEKMDTDDDIINSAEEIIFRCCSIKGKIVENDELDKGERMVLNFGHTIGHAVEKYYGFDKYTHGEGVGIGMIRMTDTTERLNITEKGTTERIEKLLKKFNLPTSVQMDSSEIHKIIKMDKKKSGSKITIIVLKKIGQGELIKIDFKDIGQYII